MLIEQLKAKIEAKGISIRKLALRAGIHRETIYNFLRGKSSMSVKNWEKLMETLNQF